ncbi:TPA: DNA cytosine methyltransferase [Campylobacter jejuni]|nr:DNA cytosine methyltransferase [Campylobacter jejuni]HEF7706537.1 DNA cytosine methyltransferase [Campylobacter jejuni]HEF8756149.1 DNA cytosine methyltransferase [Campylobacter jejuni]
MFPKKENSQISIKKVIDDLPKLKNGEKSKIPNHNAMMHSNQMLEKMSYIKDGGNKEQIPPEIRPKSGDMRKYIRYNSAKPSITITGDMRKVFHYSQNRALSARELARIQSFPDDFIFYGNSIDIQQQIGNAVAPLLAEKIANQVKIFLDA